MKPSCTCRLAVCLALGLSAPTLPANAAQTNFCSWMLAAALADPSLPFRGAESAAAKPSADFTDVTKESGVAEAITHHYATYANWWLSGLKSPPARPASAR